MPKSSYKIMKLVTQFCATSLDELLLKRAMLTPIVVPELRQLLTRLQNLQLWHCSWKSDLLAELFSQRFELRTLSLSTSAFISGNALMLQAIQVNFPQLRSFSLVGFTDNSFKCFLKMNPQLKEIRINRCRQLTGQIIQSLAKYTQIEEIQFSDILNIDENAEYFRQLRALKSIDIDFKGGSRSFTAAIKALVEARIPLECLYLQRFESNAEFVNRMVQLKQLKKIEFVDSANMNSSDIVTIVSNLSELSELYCDDLLSVEDLVKVVRNVPKLQKVQLELTRETAPTFEAKTFIEIRDLIAARQEKLRFDLFVVRDDADIEPNVPEELREANEHIFRIVFALDRQNCL